MDVDFDRRLALCASKDDPMKLWDLKMHGKEWRSSLFILMNNISIYIKRHKNTMSYYIYNYAHTCIINIYTLIHACNQIRVQESSIFQFCSIHMCSDATLRCEISSE